MAITSLDLKFRQSARMTDFDDGGGRMSNVEVVSGLTNNVFSDLSDANGIIGDVSLRLIYLQVDTNNTDPFLDPFVFLTDLPANDNVTVFLLGYQQPGSSRAQARNYFESYRVVGVKSQSVLYGDHFEGQQTMQVYCRSEVASPDIGDVLCLSVEAVGFTPAQQFVAIREVLDRQTFTFTDSSGDFQRDVLLLATTTALQQTFPGQQDPERFARPQFPSATLVRRTQVSASAKFYGFKECSTNPTTGDLVIHVETPYIQAVPTTQAETPVVDQLAGLGTRSFITSGVVDSLTFTGAMAGAAGVEITRYFGTPYGPGTLTLSVGGVALRDDGSGGVVAANPSDLGWSGTADYAVGSFSVARDVGFSASVTATATPAGALVVQSQSRAIKVTPANRNISYVLQVPGQPCPGTMVIDYIALGKWIRLTDNGRGQAVGNPGEGTATINYATGSVAMTLGALPDVDTAILTAWGTSLRARNASGEVTVPTPTVRLAMTHPGIDPGSWSLDWVSSTVAKTASADAAGVITGDASGYIDHTAGIAEFSTSVPADSGTQYHPTYDYVDPADRFTETYNPTAAGGSVSITLTNAPAKARSVSARWCITAPNPTGGQKLMRVYTVRDNGSGGWLETLTGTNSINLTTGDVVLQVE